MPRYEYRPECSIIDSTGHSVGYVVVIDIDMYTRLVTGFEVIPDPPHNLNASPE